MVLRGRPRPRLGDEDDELVVLKFLLGVGFFAEGGAFGSLRGRPRPLLGELGSALGDFAGFVFRSSGFFFGRPLRFAGVAGADEVVDSSSSSSFSFFSSSSLDSSLFVSSFFSSSSLSFSLGSADFDFGGLPRFFGGIFDSSSSLSFSSSIEEI